MALFADKSNECYDEPRYGCLCEAFHDFGISAPTMSGKMAKAVMDDFFELLDKKKISTGKDKPEEHPYCGTVEYQEYGKEHLDSVEVIASSEDEAYKKVMADYKDKGLVDCTLTQIPDYELDKMKDRILVKEELKKLCSHFR